VSGLEDMKSGKPRVGLEDLLYDDWEKRSFYSGELGWKPKNQKHVLLVGQRAARKEGKTGKQEDKKNLYGRWGWDKNTMSVSRRQRWNLGSNQISPIAQSQKDGVIVEKKTKVRHMRENMGGVMKTSVFGASQPFRKTCVGGKTSRWNDTSASMEG